MRNLYSPGMMMPKDGQVCILKDRNDSFVVAECPRLARIASEQGKRELEHYSNIRTLTRALEHRYKDLESFEIHAAGLDNTEKTSFEQLKEKMGNLKLLRYR